MKIFARQNRRSFVKNALKASALTSASMYIPRFLSDTPTVLRKKTNHGRKLVVIQLSGGNDGLNTIVPYRNDIYYKERPKLGIPPEDVIPISDELGFHPALKGFAELYDQGWVSIINNVGYPNPNRSHFRSMDIWQTASASDEYLSTGWVGRWLDAACAGGDPNPILGVEIDDILSLAMKGDKVKGLAVKDPKALYQNTHDPFFHAIADQPINQKGMHDEVAYLHKTLMEATQSATYIYEQSKIAPSKTTYPANEFAIKLKTIAELIIADTETQIYYVSLPGFDTHVSQKFFHKILLKRYANALSSFVEDLDKNNLLNDTLILTFSEFGRRVSQNASKGTDHGTANNAFLISGNLNEAGIYNSGPDLLNLEDGDLKYQIDFRQIYSTILSNWLQIEPSLVLGGFFQPLSILA